MGNEMKEKVLELVRLKGPVTPTQITKEIGVSTFISSALLSELASGDKIKISNVKMGSTPLYYAPGQEEKLQEFTKYLHDKEQKAYESLKKDQVLRDQTLDPVVRVALRGIKDFAKPLNVALDGNEELFWKWYLLSNQDAEFYIKKLLGLDAEEKKEPEMTAKEEVVKQEPEIKKKTDKQEMKEPLQKKRAENENIKLDVESDMGKKIDAYFKKNKVEIVREIEAKKTEASYIISVPSNVGSVRYYCKIKDKKNCNEGDLSTAYVVGENKKLPVLFLTTGELTKKAKEMLEEEFNSLNVKQI